jgi:hypothetical protein
MLFLGNRSACQKCGNPLQWQQSDPAEDRGESRMNGIEVKSDREIKAAIQSFRASNTKYICLWGLRKVDDAKEMGKV